MIRQLLELALGQQAFEIVQSIGAIAAAIRKKALQLRGGLRDRVGVEIQKDGAEAMGAAIVILVPTRTLYQCHLIFVYVFRIEHGGKRFAATEAFVHS
tara:strand:+ start:5479 stop:5772 length:294 start_codon:yes stop_codon:yes gene_type:complete